MTGCQQSNEEVTAVENEEEKVTDLHIEKYTGEPVKVYDVIYTLDEVMTLVIEGLETLEDIDPLLNQLDEHQIPATFFVTNEEMNMYPEVVEEVIHRGHKIENNALYKMDRKALTENEMYYLLMKITSLLKQIQVKNRNMCFQIQKKRKGNPKNSSTIRYEWCNSSILFYP